LAALPFLVELTAASLALEEICSLSDFPVRTFAGFAFRRLHAVVLVVCWCLLVLTCTYVASELFVFKRFLQIPSGQAAAS